MARKPALEPWSAAGLTRDAHVHSAKAGRTQPEQSSDPLRTHSNEQVGSETALAEEAQVTPQNPADTASSWRTMEARPALPLAGRPRPASASSQPAWIYKGLFSWRLRPWQFLVFRALKFNSFEFFQRD